MVMNSVWYTARIKEVQAQVQSQIARAKEKDVRHRYPSSTPPAPWPIIITKDGPKMLQQLVFSLEDYPPEQDFSDADMMIDPEECEGN
jgi:hypothetical protein